MRGSFALFEGLLARCPGDSLLPLGLVALLNGPGFLLLKLHGEVSPDRDDADEGQGTNDKKPRGRRSALDPLERVLQNSSGPGHDRFPVLIALEILSQ